MKTYPLTPQQLNALRTRLLELGVTLPDGEEGVLIHGGIQLKYYYYAAGNLLTLSILKKPMVLPAYAIWNEVGAWITAATTN